MADQLPSVGHSTASAFMRGPRPVPAHIERAVRASNAAGLPASAITIDHFGILLIVETTGAVRLQTTIAEPAQVASTLRLVADMIEDGSIGGERVVPDGEGDR